MNAFMTRLVGQGLALMLTGAAALAAPATACKGTLYLTFDTGNMRHAELIAETLTRHGVKATFFVAQEKTFRGDQALDPSWAPYWQARVAEGHAFGSHTWRHGSFREDSGGLVRYRLMDGRSETLDARAVCDELKRPDTRFQELTGRRLDPIWRAPGGRTTANTLAAAQACGYRTSAGRPPAFSATNCLRRPIPTPPCSAGRSTPSRTATS
jgi:peptidoglycan/xylan/chitin deacetylase (PgdA/CDA1 family)